MTHAHDEDENELGWVTLNPQIEAKAYEAAREAYRDAPHAPLYAAIATYLSASQEAAAPSEEPVAWMVRSANYPLGYFSDEGSADIWANSPGVLDSVVTPLFASPAVAPVAVRDATEIVFGILWPQQEWNGEEGFCRAVAEKVVRTLALSSIIPATKGGEDDQNTKDGGADV